MPPQIPSMYCSGHGGYDHAPKFAWKPHGDKWRLGASCSQCGQHMKWIPDHEVRTLPAPAKPKRPPETTASLF